MPGAGRQLRDRGHFTPFPVGRLTLRPGEQQSVTFPNGRYWHGWFAFDRSYPVTVAASPGTLPSSAFDIIIDAKANEQPPQP